jgi:mono/diheme cytochrome c family protein
MALGKWKRILGFGLLTVGVGAAGGAYHFRPLPLDPAPSLASLDADRSRGEYLATASNCKACHTPQDGETYAGGVAFHTDFGTIYSTNITSSTDYGIGGWTFEDFHRALRHGLRPNGEHLYPAFPYTHFAGMSDDDIASLYLHFASLEPVEADTPANRMDFPFGERRLMHFWNRMFHKAAPFAPDPGRSPEWNRGAYLVENVAHCGACHSPRNGLGAIDAGRALSGGTHIDHVLDGRYRSWSAVDLTPSSDGLGKWSSEDLVAYLRSGISAHAIVQGPMNDVVLGSTSQMSLPDVEAIATYLKNIDPDESAVSWPLVAGDYDLGQTVYTVHCGTCHLPDGKGDPTLGVSLVGNATVQAEDPASLINTILYGPQLPPPPFSVSRTRMKPFGKRLSDEDIAAVATYIRNSFGNDASSVSTAQVRRQR